MWATATAYTEALTRRSPLELVAGDGPGVAFDVTRWLDDPDLADLSVLQRCVEPVLDLGCGPGRMVRACYARGIAALGVDVARDVARLSNDRGGPALHQDVFEKLPAEGRWATVLLLDGNIGIGGDVGRLLDRTAALLAPGGTAVVELRPDAGAERRMSVRFRVDGRLEDGRFGWSVIGRSGLVPLAERAGLRPQEWWTVDGRLFLALTRG